MELQWICEALIRPVNDFHWYKKNDRFPLPSPALTIYLPWQAHGGQLSWFTAQVRRDDIRQ